MSAVVSRTCTEIREENAELSASRASRPLESFREESAYVLLGDPGAGKSTAFDTECGAPGDGACLVTARDLLTFDVQAHPEWRGKTLFIDGLDEVRAGAGDVRTPFDAIRGQLDKLGKPPFRLSCREADWLGANDQANLTRVSPDARVTVLRLDPLTDHDIEQILDSHSAVDDAGEFMELAREKGVDGFLRNPQSLGLLVRVVGGSRGWPTSRWELFDIACRQMVREHNDEHTAATQSLSRAVAVADGLTEEALLDAAGLLCAVQLVAGVAGFAVTENGRSAGYPLVDECTHEWDARGASVAGVSSHLRQLRRTLATKLFRSPAQGRFSPVHRHVAEFLGARYLAGLIGGDHAHGRNVGGGLSYRRVTLMLTGFDGVVVTELRGLSAWLAVQSESCRGELIQRDPIGVGLYGDVCRFSAEEKRALLASLQVQAFQLSQASRGAAAFRALATPEMEPVFRRVLTDPSRSDDHQRFVYFVLQIVAQGASMTGMFPVLLELVRDNTWSPGINKATLDALICSIQDEREIVTILKKLLVDLRSGRVSDPDEELMGTILRRLYPEDLAPSEVWDYFSIPSNKAFVGAYWLFWRRDLTAKCSDAQIAEHLDTLAAKIEDLRPVMQDRVLRELPLELLSLALDAHGSRIATRRLYDWLGVGLPATEFDDQRTSEAARPIRAWLEQHAEIQKAVFAEGVQRYTETDDRNWALVSREVMLHLHGSTLPADCGVWCLNQAIEATDKRTSRMYLERTFAALADSAGDVGLSLEVLLERTRAHPHLAGIVSNMSVWPLDAAHLERMARVRDRIPYQEQVESDRQEWIDHLRSHEAEFRANRAPPSLLHGIALRYFEIALDVEGDNPLARLSSFLRNDRRLVEMALGAFRGVVHRDDLPGVAEIVRLESQNRLHFLALPLLAGLWELERTEPDGLAHLNERQVRIALAFRYYRGSHRESNWYRQLLATHPNVVAGVLVECAASGIRRAVSRISGMYELAHDDGHAAVARVACLPLLRVFPIRCTLKQLDSLDDLLWAAILRADRLALQVLIEEKLSRKAMNDAQRARWLVCGVVTAEGRYESQLREFASGRERRIRHVAGFLCADEPQRFTFVGVRTSVLELFISLLGVWCRLEDRFVGGWVTPAMEASRRVGGCIGELASRCSPEAGAALDALVSEPALSGWHTDLNQARDAQRVVRRDAVFRHPNIEQVCRTLNDGPPANAGDLAALVTDRLEEIGAQIRNGNTDDWRQYWNEDSHGRTTKRKPENSCRDALLSDLKQRLPEDVDASPEGHYVNDKRADIRVFCRGFQAPVEVKKDTHPKLWSALRDQLVALYVRDPETDGYGIYLVLWFGQSGEVNRACMPPPPTGALPRSTGELKERLEATLTRDEKRKIAVCVIDVSPGKRSSTTPSAR